MKQFSIPIFIRVFKRPELTNQLLNTIASINPVNIYVCSDGPREDVIGESEKIQETRQIIDNFRWHNKPKVNKLYLNKNTGFPNILPKGLDWFFNENEYGIFLDDDHDPNISFFNYCHELLLRYRNDNQIHIITGSNFIPSKTKTKNSYFFSKITDSEL